MPLVVIEETDKRPLDVFTIPVDTTLPTATAPDTDTEDMVIAVPLIVNAP
jgi:hypothetical protein